MIIRRVSPTRKVGTSICFQPSKQAVGVSIRYKKGKE